MPVFEKIPKPYSQRAWNVWNCTVIVLLSFPLLLPFGWWCHSPRSSALTSSPRTPVARKTPAGSVGVPWQLGFLAAVSQQSSPFFRGGHFSRSARQTEPFRDLMHAGMRFSKLTDKPLLCGSLSFACTRSFSPAGSIIIYFCCLTPKCSQQRFKYTAQICFSLSEIQ